MKMVPTNIGEGEGGEIGRLNNNRWARGKSVKLKAKVNSEPPRKIGLR